MGHSTRQLRNTLPNIETFWKILDKRGMQRLPSIASLRLEESEAPKQQPLVMDDSISGISGVEISFTADEVTGTSDGFGVDPEPVKRSGSPLKSELFSDGDPLDSDDRRKSFLSEDNVFRMNV